MAVSRDIGSTSLVYGYVAAKTGSKMAARYRGSIGEALEDVMTEPS
jgi:hypothetical protein